MSDKLVGFAVQKNHAVTWQLELRVSKVSVSDHNRSSLKTSIYLILLQIRDCTLYLAKGGMEHFKPLLQPLDLAPCGAHERRYLFQNLIGNPLIHH